MDMRRGTPFIDAERPVHTRGPLCAYSRGPLCSYSSRLMHTSGYTCSGPVYTSRQPLFAYSSWLVYTSS
jgi:hypothetical protein